MSSFGDKIKRYVDSRKEKRIYRFTAAALSFIVAFSVTSSLVLPAMSATETAKIEDAINQDQYIMLADADPSGVPEWVKKFDKDTNGIDLSNNVTGKFSDTSVSADGNTITGQFSMEYDVPEVNDSNRITKDRPFLYYTISDNVKIPEGGYSGNVIDKGNSVGRYFVDENGLVIIEIYEQFIDEYASGYTGTLGFKAEVTRKEDETGTKTEVQVGNQTIEVEGFTEKKLGVEKTGSVVDDKTGTIEWTITVDNPKGDSLNGHTITDTMFGADTVVTTDPPNAGTYNPETKTFTFGNVNDKQVTLKYQTKLTDEQLIAPGKDGLECNWDKTEWHAKVKNSMSYNKNDGSETLTDSDEVKYKLAYSLQKSGKANYNTGKIDWTVTVKNVTGRNVDGLKIQDAAFAKFLNQADELKFDPSDVTGTLSGDTLTLSSESGYAGDVNITYSTDAVEGSNTNSVSIPDGPWTDEKSVEYHNQTFTKDGHCWDGATEVTWTLTIDNIGNADSINGKSVIDEMLKNMVGDLTITGYKKVDYSGYINDEKIEDYFNNIHYNFDKENGTITFKDISDDDNLDKIVIEFKTSKDDAVYDESTGKYSVSNHAEFGEGKSSDKTVEWDAKNSVTKTHGEKTEIKDTDGTVKQWTIPWTIVIEQEAGKFKGLTMDDIVLSNDGEDGLLHYITEEQLKDLKIVDQNGAPLPADCYTVEKTLSDDGKTTQFHIKFTDNSHLDSVTKVTINYNTTADIENVQKGTLVAFNNKVTFNGKESKPNDPPKYENVDEGKAPYVKYDATFDINGQESGVTTKSVNDLKVVQVNGKDYYKFDYTIVVNGDDSKYSSAYTIEDIFPEGFELYTKEKGNTGEVVKWSCNNYTGDIFGWGTHSTNSHLSEDGKKLVIYEPQYISVKSTFEFSLIVSKEYFDQRLANGLKELVNTVKDSEDKYKPTTQTQKFEESTLTKNRINEKNEYGEDNYGAGYIEYEVKINPNGDKLSSADTLVLEDIIKANKDDKGNIITDQSVVNAYLDNITVYRINEDGTETPLENDQYSYVLDNNPEVESKNGVVSDKKHLQQYGYNSDNWGYTVTGLEPGSKVKIVFDGKYEGWGIVYDGIGSQNKKFSTFDNIGTKYDEKGNTVWETTALNSDSITIAGSESISSIKSVTCDGRPYVAKLSITVPDEMPIKIVYKYLVRRPEISEDKKDDKMTMVNTVNVNTSMITESSSNESEMYLRKESDATISATDGYIVLEKVDVGNYSKKLNATFNLYKWDETTKTWLVATKFSKDTVGSVNVNTVVSADWEDEATGVAAKLELRADEVYNFKPERGVMYKLVEVDPPEGYVKLEEPRYFVYGKYSGGIPPDVKDYTIVNYASKVYIQNYRYIQVGVHKTWLDEDVDHTSDSVTVELYRSHTKVTDGFPGKLEYVEGSRVELNQENNWTWKWDGLESQQLPNGTDEGQPWYYYVKEVSYTIGSETYTVGEKDAKYVPYYGNSGLNDNGTVEVTNTAGLTVRKIWRDYDGKEGQPKNPEIIFKIYRSKTQLTTGQLPPGAELVGDAQGYVLNAGNNWKMTFNDIIKPYDDAGQPYYYYVVETSELADNKVSYAGNGFGSVGLITITNKSTKIVIGHMPETGSFGTMWFYTAGGILTVGSLGALRILRRRRSEQSCN